MPRPLSARAWFDASSFHQHGISSDLPAYTPPVDGQVDERGRVYCASRGGWWRPEHLAEVERVAALLWGR